MTSTGEFVLVLIGPLAHRSSKRAPHPGCHSGGARSASLVKECQPHDSSAAHAETSPPPNSLPSGRAYCQSPRFVPQPSGLPSTSPTRSTVIGSTPKALYSDLNASRMPLILMPLILMPQECLRNASDPNTSRLPQGIAPIMAAWQCACGLYTAISAGQHTAF